MIGPPSLTPPSPISPSLSERQRFLGLAIAEAERGARAGQGGPFGALVVKDGLVIACAANAVVAQNDPTAHAEIQAIRAACRALASFRLDNCDLYASCEPCPMCMGAILWARPRAVYYAAARSAAEGAGFDDAAFYRAMQGDQALPLVVERVACTGAEAPFDLYRQLPHRDY